MRYLFILGLGLGCKADKTPDPDGDGRYGGLSHERFFGVGSYCDRIT